MKPSSRIQKALRDLDVLKYYYVDFFTSGREDARKECCDIINNARDLLLELSIDRKINNIRLVKKLDMIRNINENKRP